MHVALLADEADRLSALQLNWAAPTLLNDISINVIVLVRLHSFKFWNTGRLWISHLHYLLHCFINGEDFSSASSNHFINGSALTQISLASSFETCLWGFSDGLVIISYIKRSVSTSPSRYVESWRWVELGVLLPHTPNYEENIVELFRCCNKIVGNGPCIS